MKENLKNGNLLYDIDRGIIKRVTEARLQLPRVSNSFIGSNNTNSNATTNSILTLNKDVNTTIKYSSINIERIKNTFVRNLSKKLLNIFKKWNKMEII